jgi:IS5 family transposase
MKCLLLQQWFKIDSDPELETQINDRISFKKFLGLSFDDPAPIIPPSPGSEEDSLKTICA